MPPELQVGPVIDYARAVVSLTSVPPVCLSPSGTLGPGERVVVRLSFEAKLLPQLLEGEISCMVQVRLRVLGESVLSGMGCAA